MKKMQKKYVWLAVAVVLIGGYFYWKNKNSTASKQVQYKTAQVEKGTLSSAVSASGNVAVDKSATVDPTITGTVSDLAVNVGDAVKKGDFLFSIVNDDLSVSVAKGAASYEQAKNSLESAKVDKDSAEADYDAAKKKDKENPNTYTREQLEVLKDKIDLAENKVVQAEKSLAATAADYRNTQKNASKRRVTSPIDGTVNEINIKNGDDLAKISSGSAKVSPLIIGDLSTLKVEITVNEVDISKVSIGQKAVIKLDALDGFTALGKVEKMDSLGTISQGVVSYNVTIGFDELNDKIKSGMSASVSLVTDVKQDALIVPNSALKSDSSGYYVQVLNGQTPERKDVKIGIANNTSTEITSGVNVGDNVVTQTINSGSTTASSSGSGSSSSSSLRIPGLSGGGGLH